MVRSCVAVSFAALLGMLVACTGTVPPGSFPNTVPTVKPEQWSKAGAKYKTDALQIEVLWVQQTNVSGLRYGDFVNYGPQTVVKLHITNRSKDKLINFAGWQETAVLQDEAGNTYKRLVFSSGFGFNVSDTFGPGSPEDKGCDADQIIAANLSLHPGKSYATCLFFEKMIETAKETRLTVPGASLGISGDVHFRVPIGH